MIDKLRDMWDKGSELAAAWGILATELEQPLEDKVTTVGDALEQFTIADMLSLYPAGFAVSAKAGLYELTGAGEYDAETGVGQLYARQVIKGG